MVLMAPKVLVQAQSTGLDPRIVKLVNSVSEERLQQLLQRLSSYKTRNTCSDPGAPDAIGAARQWIYDELKRMSPKLQVSFDTHQLPTIPRCAGGPFELRNVMAILPGNTPRRIYVSGHYDSVSLGGGGQQASNARAGRDEGAAGAGRAGGGGAAGAAGARGAQTRPGAAPQAPGEPAADQPQAPRPPARDPNVPAPGANDDGSGTVLSMELARVFAESGIQFD